MMQHQGAVAGQEEKLTLPPLGYNLAEGETFRVRVFREHPEWDRHEKWWMLPSELLEELFVCSYDCEYQEQLNWIANQHPGAVFVY
jgi:hypothetical protein